MASRDRVEFDVVGRDSGGSAAFKAVGQAADKAADQIEDAGKQAAVAGEQIEGAGKKADRAGDQVDGLGDQTERAGEQAEDAGRQYRGLAADIAAAQAAAHKLAEEINKTGNMDLVKDLDRQRREIRRLTRVQDLLPDMDKAGAEAAVGFVARFGARLGPLMASAPIGPAGAAAGVVLGAAAAPTIAAAVSGAVVGGVGVGGVVGGMVLAARDPQVKAAGTALGTFILGDLESRAAGFVPPVLEGIHDIRAGWQAMGPDLDRIFESSRFVDPLVQGAISGGRKLVTGLADAVDEADPVIDALGRGFEQVGRSVGDAFSSMADDADEGAEAIDELTMAVSRFVDTSAKILHNAATVKRWSGEVDVAIDKGRYWIEDSSYLSGALEHVGVNLDITADGFAKGSKEAEAYRKVTLGTAEAADFATLKTAGMSDAQIAAKDASGTYRQKLDEVNDALGNTPAAVEDAIAAVRDWYAALDEMTGKNLDARQAQRDLEAAIDDATAAVTKNGETAINHGAALDENSAKGRDNAAALDGIARKANDAYEAVLAQTGSQELANDAAERGRAKFITLAQKMGLSESAAIALADSLIRIKDKRVTVTADTSPALNSARGIVARINNMHARIKVSAEPSGGYGGSAYTGDGYSTGMSEGGAVTGPGPKGIDTEPRLLAVGEHVLTAQEVDALGGHRAVEQLRAMVRGETAGPQVATASAGRAAPSGVDVRLLADLVERGVTRALSRATLVLDDRTGRTATLIARGA